MLFSDLKDIFNNSKIVGKLPKKKIKYLTDYSKNVDGNTLLVINKKKKFQIIIFKRINFEKLKYYHHQ